MTSIDPATTAANPQTPPAVLVELAGHVDPAVRQAVAGNPSTPQRARLVLRQPAEEPGAGQVGRQNESEDER